MSVSVCVYAEMSAFLILFILQFTPLLPCLPDIVTLLGTTCNVTTLFTVIFRSKYCTVRRFLLLLLNLMPAMLHSLVVLVRVVLFLCRHFNTLLWLLMPLQLRLTHQCTSALPSYFLLTLPPLALSLKQGAASISFVNIFIVFATHTVKYLISRSARASYPAPLQRFASTHRHIVASNVVRSGMFLLQLALCLLLLLGCLLAASFWLRPTAMALTWPVFLFSSFIILSSYFNFTPFLSLSFSFITRMLSEFISSLESHVFQFCLYLFHFAFMHFIFRFTSLGSGTCFYTLGFQLSCNLRNHKLKLLCCINLNFRVGVD